MSYRWVPTAGEFSQAELAEQELLPTFEDQAAAEQWLSESYEELLHHGVLAASLYHDEHLVYGPMGLTA